ncbi:hypothetical protein Fcan01_23099 [Folsomia candida]|uniref:Uncharacterized protein n=1 Tax=Folsomia candida TaxID=158441 RepID=A0A226DAR2_FOLCA|nr:hypothetical protein Fcan01_23099 [Folsomia candida]
MMDGDDVQIASRFYMSCRQLNPVAKEKMDGIQKQALLKREFQFKAEREEKEKKIARLEARNLELSLIVGEQQARLHAREASGVGVGVLDDGMDDVLSQIEDPVHDGNTSVNGDVRKEGGHQDGSSKDGNNSAIADVEKEGEPFSSDTAGEKDPEKN